MNWDAVLALECELDPLDGCTLEPVDREVDELVCPADRLGGGVTCDEPVEWPEDFEDEPFEGGFPANPEAASDAVIRTASTR